jgi:hypothetical protein
MYACMLVCVCVCVCVCIICIHTYVQSCVDNLTCREISEAEAGCLTRSLFKHEFSKRDLICIHTYVHTSIPLSIHTSPSVARATQGPCRQSEGGHVTNQEEGDVVQEALAKKKIQKSVS